MLNMVRRVVAADDAPVAYCVLANDLRSILGCRQVAIGMCRRRIGRCRLEAISGVRNFDRQSKIVKLMEAVMEEATIADALRVPDIDESSAFGDATSAQRDLVQATDAAHILCRAIRDHSGTLIGACLAVDDGEGNATRVEQEMRNVADAVATCIKIVRNTTSHSARRLVARVANVDGVRRRVAASFIVAAVGLAMFVPTPYKVPCECVLQPVARKYVAVPYDGVLEKVLVEPGDVTTRGQVLAQMDVREIQWELAGLHADHSRSQKQIDANLAARDTASAQLAKLEMERLEVKIHLLENRANHLEIKSPTDGVVISGDPRKTEGARLTLGQTLFEIGPLDHMVVELEVPDEDVSHIAVGQPVEIRLEAYLGRTLFGTIARIHPRSEMREQENVFRAEVLVDNSQRSLRPGMRGHARVRTASHALVWILFHKAWQRLPFLWSW
jgi:multidrug efflux pump subunit AcrA (membrane-fusion protein)